MSRARRVAACACTLVVFGAGAATAQAGTVTVFEGAETSHSSDKFLVTYTASPGEQNRVIASWEPASETFALTDTGVSRPFPGLPELPVLVIPGSAGCITTGQTTTCRPTNGYVVARFVIDLGDGNDSARLDNGGASGHLHGRAGDDTLTAAGTGYSLLQGYEGNDVLTGGAGHSDLFGGLGGDVFNGGSGVDRLVQYTLEPDPQTGEIDSGQSPTGGVSITLDGLANDGMAGEGDNVTGTVDRIHGTGYADVLVGNVGSQTLIGESGDDVIQTRDGDADGYVCGAGTDSVTADSFDFADGPAGDCETVEVL